MAQPSQSPQRKPNRLALQSSPYLLQHAHNPVDWYPWGEEAFAEARRRDVPILLSVGYSTCYWCHVMERECFEDEAIGRLMSERFVCIKLDREERPDVDEIYMTALQLLTGHGGWPMNMFLEPQKLRPYWGGTYFPPDARANMPAWPRVLESMSDVWSKQRAGAMEQAAAIEDAVADHLGKAVEPVAVGEAQVTDALSRLLRMFDRTNGGFGAAPKFPQPAFIEYLLDVRSIAGDDSTLDALDEAAKRSLNRMMCGGIFDQAGGGFHRYSVDATWTVPHFEKMLYDNAQLAHVYARAAGVYGDPQFARVARRTCEYMLREMRGESGLFFSAQDAEVDGREGLNYLWMPEQVRAVLSADDAALAIKVYGLEGEPSFQDPHHPGEAPSFVLRMTDRIDRVAASLNMPAEALGLKLDRINAALLAERSKRKQPRLDDKVLGAWNGLAIGAMARSGRETEEPRFVEAAKQCAAGVQASLVRGDGTLLRSARQGVPGPAGVLEDYAFVIAGLIELHRAIEATGGPRSSEHMQAAVRLADVARREFADSSGRWFDTRADQPDLFVRTAATNDGAMPSSLSVMLHNLLDLFELTGNEAYRNQGAALLAAVSGSIGASTVSCINSTRALLRVLTTDALRAAVPSGATPAPGADDDVEIEPFLPVEVYSDAERLMVSADKPAVLRLVLKIAQGYHIIAAEPGVEGEETPRGLVPLRASVRGGSGVRVFAEYPRGTEYGPEGSRVMVHQGTVEFRAVVEREGEWSGRPMLMLTYQACTETACLEARTVELDVAVDAG